MRWDWMWLVGSAMANAVGTRVFKSIVDTDILDFYILHQVRIQSLTF